MLEPLPCRFCWTVDSNGITIVCRTHAKMADACNIITFRNSDYGSIFFGIEFVGPVGGLYEFATADNLKRFEQ